MNNLLFEACTVYFQIESKRGDYEWNTVHDASARAILAAETKNVPSVFREKDISAKFDRLVVHETAIN